MHYTRQLHDRRKLVHKFFMIWICGFISVVTPLMAVESMGRYEGKRVGAAPGEPASIFDVMAFTYTVKGKLNVQISFQNNDESILKIAGPDAFQFFFELTLDEYEKIFEGKTPLQNYEINEVIWNRKISTKIEGNHRTITVVFENPITQKNSEGNPQGNTYHRDGKEFDH